MIKFCCRCLFDITPTGITGHFKSSRVPFNDRVGTNINSEAAWNRARNQQRNWETLTQLISLRTQIHDVTDPVKINGVWQFEFASETPDVYGPANDPTGILKADADGVPMLIIVDHNQILASELIVAGPDQNVWFEQITINN